MPGILALGCSLALGCAAPRAHQARYANDAPGAWSSPPVPPVLAPAPAPLVTSRPGPAAHSAAGPEPAYCSAAFQAQFGWPDPDKAARVCQCESSGNPRAASGNGRYFGLFQFSADAWAGQGGGDVFDPFTNSHHAHRLFRRRGWRPWPHCGRR